MQSVWSEQWCVSSSHCTLNTSVYESYRSGQSAVCSWFIILYRTWSYQVRQSQHVRNISPQCTADVYITADLICDALLRTASLQHAASGSSGSYIWYIILMNFGVQRLALVLLTYESLALNLCTHIGCPNRGFPQFFLTSSWIVIQIRQIPHRFQLITHPSTHLTL
jgi:hypothetical protein